MRHKWYHNIWDCVVTVSHWLYIRCINQFSCKHFPNVRWFIIVHKSLFAFRSCNTQIMTTMANTSADIISKMISNMCSSLKCIKLMYITRSLASCLNTLRPRQNGRHFPNTLFKCVISHENAWISIRFALKFVPEGLINNNPALVWIKYWHRLGDKPLF